MTTVTAKPRTIKDILLIILFCSLLVLPIAFIGIPDNYDLAQHLRFARTFNDSLTALSITPSWESRDNFGFGSVGVRFYPPLLYVSTTIFHAVSGTWYDAIWLTILFWMIISCVGVYLFTREILADSYPLMAAALYAIAPYHLVQVYQAFLLAEFTASAILPFCFLFTYRILKHQKWLDAILLAVSFSLLTLSHIPSTVIGSITLLLFVLLLLEKKNIAQSFWRFAAAGLLSLLMTSFYWIRLITEMEWVKHNSKQFYGEGLYNYSTYLFPMLLNGGDAYMPRFMWLWDIIIIMTVLLLIPSIVLFILDRKRKQPQPRGLFTLTTVGIFTFLMMSSATKLLWDNIATLQKIQFPWRWLALTTFLGSVAFVFAVSIIVGRSKNLTRPVAYSLAMIVTVILIFDLTQAIMPSAPVPRGKLNERLANIDSEAGCACWWPAAATAAAFDNKDRVTLNGREVTVKEWAGSVRNFSASAGEPGEARIATFNYPYWKAAVNGNEVQITTSDDGSMLIPLPSENSDVVVTFTEPAFLIVAKYVSLAAWIALIIAFLSLRPQKNKG